jgi:hypothetical protein
MKIFGLLIILLFTIFPGRSWGNRIDSLQSDNEVVSFLQSVNGDFSSGNYKKIELRSSQAIRAAEGCDGMADQWQVNNWEKADFNGDGLTDLVVILFWYDYGVYVVIDKENNQFDLLTLSYNVHDQCNLAKPVKVNGQQLLLYYGKKDTLRNMNGESKYVNQVDSLIYRFGDFIEYNKASTLPQIDSVEFHTSYCDGNCPMFNMNISRNGYAEYLAGVYNPKEGRFSTIMKKKDLDELFELMSYIGIDKLRGTYSVPWATDQSNKLRIKFSDGTFKEVKANGMRGTFGLRLLYKKIFSYRINQDWK